MKNQLLDEARLFPQSTGSWLLSIDRLCRDMLHSDGVLFRHCVMLMYPDYIKDVVGRGKGRILFPLQSISV